MPIPANQRVWTLAERPVGRDVRVGDFRLETRPTPAPASGQFLVKTQYLGVAAAMRSYMLNATHFERPLAIGDVMHGRGVGRIIASNHPDFAVGKFVHGKLGWQEYALADGSPYFLMYKVQQRVAPVSTALGVLGLTGFTSYLGLVDIGRVKSGDVVLVSGAAGGVGSSVGQIARNVGARAVGLAGTPEKCALLTARLGYDAAINYRTEDVHRRLGELCPDGVDVVFDNVGGEILDISLLHIRRHARIVLCGQISQYVGSEERPRPLENFYRVFKRMGRVEAFFIYEMADRFAAAEAKLAEWIAAGRLVYQEDILEGIERMPEALVRLFEGRNIGKQLVRVDPDAR